MPIDGVGSLNTTCGAFLNSTLTSVTVVNWVGQPGSPGFGAPAWVGGGVVMGWCGGAQLAQDVWLLVRAYVPKAKRKLVADKIVRLFENEDADTLEDEAEQLWLDSGRKPYDEDE